jgi:hypothetical protein
MVGGKEMGGQDERESHLLCLAKSRGGDDVVSSQELSSVLLYQRSDGDPSVCRSRGTCQERKRPALVAVVVGKRRGGKRSGLCVHASSVGKKESSWFFSGRNHNLEKYSDALAVPLALWSYGRKGTQDERHRGKTAFATLTERAKDDRSLSKPGINRELCEVKVTVKLALVLV